MIVSTFSEVRDASADNSASLQDASFKTRKPDANPEIVDAPDHRSFTSLGHVQALDGMRALAGA